MRGRLSIDSTRACLIDGGSSREGESAPALPIFENHPPVVKLGRIKQFE